MIQFEMEQLELSVRQQELIKAAFWYAANVIKGRWSEAEPFILKDLFYAYCYAKNIIKGKWPEAEPVILTSKWRYDYLKFLKST